MGEDGGQERPLHWLFPLLKYSSCLSMWPPWFLIKPTLCHLEQGPAYSGPS